MKILGIDPGPEKTAFISTTITGPSAIHIHDLGIVGNNEMLERVLRQWGYDGFTPVCEMVACYGMAVGKEVFETVRWIGRFEQRLADQQQRMETLVRLKVKMTLCQDSRAKDANIRQALIDRFGPPGSKNNKGPLYGVSSHLWAALAIAATWYDTTHTSIASVHPQSSAIPA